MFTIRATPSPCLVVVRGPEYGRQYDMGRRPLQVIGRAASCDIIVDEESVTQVHATISTNELGFRLECPYGVLVNDQSTHSTLLEHGDLVEIGLTTFAVLIPHDSESEYAEYIYQICTIDVPTGVFNWRYAYDTFSTEISRSRRYDRPISIAMLDIDGFERINEAHGRGVGNRLLRMLATLIRERSRKVDVVALYDGDAFAIILPELDRPDATSFAKSLRAAIEQHDFEIDGRAIALTVSIGVAALRPEHDADDMIELATRCLGKAKQRGRNRVVSAR